MQFERDIFISYAHIDNIDPEGGQDGWVTTLHRGLEIRLAQLRGEQPKIWRDQKLQGNDDFNDTILDQFPNLAVLVSVLSPRYVKSEWCLRELDHFFKAAQQRGGIKVGDNKHRVFKVIKTYLPRKDQPVALDKLLGYEFYDFDGAGRPHEFSRLYGPESIRKFWAKLEDLAYDIHQTLEILEALPEDNQDLAQLPPLPASGNASGKIIYLAETTADLGVEREKIRRELEQAGHLVLPNQALPDPPAFEQTAYQNLAQCDLSVHLISPYPASQHSASDLSIEQLHRQLTVARTRKQIELAAQRQQEKSSFKRILWMPPGSSLASMDEFIQALQSEPDFLSTNLENLKTEIHDRLIQPVTPVPESTEDLVQVYLDCDERDLETPDIEPLYDWLEQHFQVVLPDFEDNGVARSEGLLKQCEAVLIYYGEASGLWLKRRLLALKKTLYGRPKPLLAKAVYVANPAKHNFADPEVPVIEGCGQFNPTLLESFLAQLGQV